MIDADRYVAVVAVQRYHYYVGRLSGYVGNVMIEPEFPTLCDAQKRAQVVASALGIPLIPGVHQLAPGSKLPAPGECILVLYLRDPAVECPQTGKPPEGAMPPGDPQRS